MTSILGPARVSVDDARDWARSMKATDTFVGLARIYWDFARDHGDVRPEVAYAQAGKETAFGRFGGVINASYHNPCGMKKPGGGGNYDPHAHQRFPTWTHGIQAHLDHLALYAGAPGYPRSQTLDPRHFAALRGRAKTAEELGGYWAPASDYGLQLATLVSQMKETPPMKITPRSGWGAVPPESVVPSTPSSLKGVCVHWFGSPKAASTHAGCDDLLRSVQRSHQAGEFSDIAYNHGVCPHGQVYELRGFNRQTGANGNGVANREFSAVVYMAGTGDPFTKAGEAALRWILNEWFKKGTPEVVKPHHFFTGTECPGPAVRPWVERGGWKEAAPPPAAKHRAPWQLRRRSKLIWRTVATGFLSDSDFDAKVREALEADGIVVLRDVP